MHENQILKLNKDFLLIVKICYFHLFSYILLKKTFFSDYHSFESTPPSAITNLM
jgi:hypothetical protein